MKALICLILFSGLIGLPKTLFAQTESIFAGKNLKAGYAGDGGPATSALLSGPIAVIMDANGNFYISDEFNNVIRKVNTAGIISTVAGNGTAGYGGDGGPATSAQISAPEGVAVDNKGNLFICDAGNNVIRKVDGATGIISTYAGQINKFSFSGDGGPATSAVFDGPEAIAVDNAGNLYIFDVYNYRIRKVDAATGIINTVAGNGSNKYAGDGGPATSASFGGNDFALDNSGNIYIGDGNGYVRVVSAATGIIKTVAGNGGANPLFTGTLPALTTSIGPPQGITVDQSGNIYIFTEGVFDQITPNGMVTQFFSEVIGEGTIEGGTEYGMCCDNIGNVYLAGCNSCTVIKISPCILSSITAMPQNASVCQGSKALFNISAANASVYQWQINTTTGWVNLADNANYAGTNTAGLVVNGVTPGMNNALYRCLVSSSCSNLTSDSAFLRVSATSTVSVTISTGSNSVCKGSVVTFNAAAVNGGSAPVYQWQLNGTNVGANSSDYSNSNLSNNDVIDCIVTGSMTCTSGPGTSNSILMTVASQETPGVSITASSTEICLGMMVTFTATPANGGSAPVYQWQVNGINAGTNSPTFTASNLNNAGVVTCKMTGNSTCAPGTATSNSIVIFVTAQATPAVDITASSENICQGASVTFTAAPTNGGNAPTYQWLLNGSSVGTNSPTYTTTNLTGSDNVSCQMTGNASCASGLATSNTITVGVSTPVAPSLIITPSLTAICSGTVVTFTATSINGGNDPSYDWSVNGVSVGGNAPVFMTSALNNGDQVNCKMTSTAGCVTADRASSNTFVETVTTRLSSAVSISASANNVCSGTQVTFTGIPTNGGDTPAYHWLVNGNSSGGDSTAFTTSSLRNGDSINCIITSSLPCATTDTSSAVYMSVLPLPTVTFDPDTLYANNGDIRLTPVVTGPVSQYQWSPANGLTSATISDPVADAVDNSTYEVIVTTDSGCTAEAKVTVIADRPLQMPNAFTPNGDGHNDVFRVPPGIDLKMSGFQIFNRWGTEVFSTRNSGQGWDGTSHGIPCPAGTYVYLITGFTVSDKQVSLKGTVILIR